MGIPTNRSKTLALRRLLFFILLFVLTAYSNLRMYKGQFTGEDEPFQWVAVTGLIGAVRHGNLIDFARIVATQDQPPLRYFLSIPGVLIWPHTEIGLRFLSIIFSFIMTYYVYRLGLEIGGETVGVWSSLLIAASGVYNWTSMAFGWSVTVTCMKNGAAQFYFQDQGCNSIVVTAVQILAQGTPVP